MGKKPDACALPRLRQVDSRFTEKKGIIRYSAGMESTTGRTEPAAFCRKTLHPLNYMVFTYNGPVRRLLTAHNIYTGIGFRKTMPLCPVIPVLNVSVWATGRAGLTVKWKL